MSRAPRAITLTSGPGAAAMIAGIGRLSPALVIRPPRMLQEPVRDEQLEEAFEAGQRVTALELFFDLVFVFAITQLTGFLYRDPTWPRLLQAAAILMSLWFAWSAYAWLGNRAVDPDEGAVRIRLCSVRWGRC